MKKLYFLTMLTVLTAVGPIGTASANPSQQTTQTSNAKPRSWVILAALALTGIISMVGVTSVNAADRPHTGNP